MRDKKIGPTKLQAEQYRLQAEQYREEAEKRRSGMPGAIRYSLYWTRERHDLGDAEFARMKSPSLD